MAERGQDERPAEPSLQQTSAAEPGKLSYRASSPDDRASADPRPGRVTILLVDDDDLIRSVLADHMWREGYRTLEAKTGASALNAFERGVDLVLLDYRLPDTDGLQLLRRFRDIEPDVPVIMLTAHADVHSAVEVMRTGAYHYATKPYEPSQLALTVRRALEVTALTRQLRTLRRQHTAESTPLISASPAMAKTKRLLHRFAASPASTVLITGESGTGKDLAARVLHQRSTRAHGPFLTVTCSALPGGLLESELFGHEAGAFTDARARKKGLFEAAHGGTLFLDEIGELELPLQSKLLRFLEDKCFRRVGGTSDIRADVRIVAATNVDLSAAVGRRAFRRDLYYRLAVLTLEMPPLRERGADVELLLLHFVRRFAREFHKPVSRISDHALEALQRYSWPGNVRELRNAAERAVLLADREQLDLDDFDSLPAIRSSSSLETFRLPPGGVDLSELECSLVRQALERCGGNRTRAAALLGLNRDQIRYRIEKFRLDSAPPSPRRTRSIDRLAGKPEWHDDG